jgi:hypothetical protein
MLDYQFYKVALFQKALEAKNYAWFDNGLQYNVNIIGVRSSSPTPNAFNDVLVLCYRDESDNWILKDYPITTKPGLTQLNNPSNSKGVAILKPDQYRSAYKIGFHQNKYKALVQRKGKVTVYRDNDKDSQFDLDVTDEGFFGINIHKAGIDSSQVNEWSAGCQVFKKSSDFDEFMNIVEKSSEKYGNSFTYTLIEEKDLA